MTCDVNVEGYFIYDILQNLGRLLSWRIFNFHHIMTCGIIKGFELDTKALHML